MKDESTMKIDFSNFESAEGRPGRTIIQELMPKKYFEVGKIKIGGKSAELIRSSNGKTDYRRPVKYPEFRIFKNEKDKHDDYIVDNEAERAIASELGLKESTNPEVFVGFGIKSVPVFFYDDEPWHTSFAYYTASKKVCAGDGRVAVNNSGPSARTIKCPGYGCPFYSKGLCRKMGVLTVGLSSLPVSFGNVYVFRTRSNASIAAITGMLRIFSDLTYGRLSNIPFTLNYNTRVVKDSENVARRIPVVSLQYNGTADALREIVIRRNTVESEYRKKMLSSKNDVVDKETSGTPADPLFVEEDVKEIHEEYDLQMRNEKGIVDPYENYVPPSQASGGGQQDQDDYVYVEDDEDFQSEYDVDGGGAEDIPSAL